MEDGAREGRGCKGPGGNGEAFPSNVQRQIKRFTQVVFAVFLNSIMDEICDITQLLLFSFTYLLLTFLSPVFSFSLQLFQIIANVLCCLTENFLKPQ